jgi:hypothetical protein
VVKPLGSGFTFDHILSRLQGELKKSRVTCAELDNLTGAMNDIHDKLGRSLVRLFIILFICLIN